MHIKHIHETLERLSEIACTEVSKSVECIDTCELGAVIDMVKDLSKAEYYSIIAKEMKKAEEEDEAEEKYMLKSLKEEYGEDEGKRYYDMWRYKSGRFAPKGRGKRRGYDEPPYYHIAPDMYRDYEPDYLRGIEYGKGKMYYTEKPEHMTDETKYGNMSRYDRAKRGYEEAKEHGKEKSEKMRELESYTKELAEDVTEMVQGMSPEEKALLKNKMQTLMTKIQ